MITKNGVEYRNLEEQVRKNKDDINSILQSANFLGAKIVGHVPSNGNLPTNYIGAYGDCYAVGNTAPYDIYCYIKPNQWWKIGKWPLKGDQGEPGEDGTDGTNGTIWYIVNGEPTGSANEGDCALDSTTGDVYQYTSNGWVYEANIKGPQGNIGPTGATGPAPTIVSGSWNATAATTTTPIVNVNIDEISTGVYAMNGLFEIPKGDKGDPPSLTIGTVTATSATSASATVSVGEILTDVYALSFGFGLPQGPTGSIGPTGAGIDTWATLNNGGNPLSGTLTTSGYSWVSTATNTYTSGGQSATMNISVTNLMPLAEDSVGTVTLTKESNIVKVGIDASKLVSCNNLITSGNFNTTLQNDASFSYVNNMIDVLKPKPWVHFVTNQTLPTDSRGYEFPLDITRISELYIRIKQTTATSANKNGILYGYRNGETAVILCQITNAFPTSIGSNGRLITYRLKADAANDYYDCYGSSANTSSSGSVYGFNEAVNFASSTKEITKFRITFGSSGDTWPSGTTVDVWYR